MAISDIDIFDLIVWVAWEQRLLSLPPDARGARNRRGLWTVFLMTVFAFIGTYWKGPIGALILTALATMYAIDNYWNGAQDDEIIPVTDLLLYSEQFKDSNKREIVDAVRELTCKYETRDYAALAQLVGSHPSLRAKIAEIIHKYLLNSVCYEVALDPEIVN
ncbi:unnamed protein product [Notodromas monacha]|uniref:Uncharacterized protein n=1 Tax=Notodromas monacha TaxID=399045 RepID=A0A7R9BWR0_9CRUS|nr:unnamed protein product [Notodromas monacha]CAG0922015.1 unnamed protein product [Notodromas monacha]